MKKSRDASIELWFKIGLTQTGGPLIGYQDKAVGAAATSGVPILYTGTDGRLRGQFAGSTIAPITSTVAINDNKWHHVVLDAIGNTQTMYLDGVKVPSVPGRPSSTRCSPSTSSVPPRRPRRRPGAAGGPPRSGTSPGSSTSSPSTSTR